MLIHVHAHFRTLTYIIYALNHSIFCMPMVALSTLRPGQTCSARSVKPDHTVDVTDDVSFHWKWLFWILLHLMEAKQITLYFYIVSMFVLSLRSIRAFGGTYLSIILFCHSFSIKIYVLSLHPGVWGFFFCTIYTLYSIYYSVHPNWFRTNCNGTERKNLL